MCVLFFAIRQTLEVRIKRLFSEVSTALHSGGGRKKAAGGTHHRRCSNCNPTINPHYEQKTLQ